MRQLSKLSSSSRRLRDIVRGFGRRQYSVTAITASNSFSDDRVTSYDYRKNASKTDQASLIERGIFDDNNLLQYKTLHELQHNSSIAFSDNPLFGTYREKKNDNGDVDASFEWMTYGDFGRKVDECRTLLKDLGVKEYSKVGIIANNRWEWATISAATYSLNATMVPMYEAQLPADWTYITNDAECCVLFCASQDIYDRTVSDVLPQTPSVKAVLCLDATPGQPHAFATHMQEASQSMNHNVHIIKPKPDDLANLIYTSGTTGKPKGVELMHSNTVSNTLSIREMVGDHIHDFIRSDDRSLAFLPWAHSYGQTCELFIAMAHGGSMGICRGVPYILEDLQLVRPTVLFAVPTLHKKIYDGVHKLIDSSPPLRQSLMKKALKLGRKNVESKNGVYTMGLFERLQYNTLDKLVLSKIRDKFGGRLRHGFVAGAACPGEIINFLDDIGIPICEGYGLTETSPIIAINTPYDRSPGYVGKSIPDVEVVIMGENGLPVKPGEEGEICCYGPNVMKGYYKNQEATDEVISLAPDRKSRLFHTGDLGSIDGSGFVKITGRLKEQYKLENGKYVCPTPIEEAINMSKFVTQVVLCGANRPYNVCLIVPDWIAIRVELNISDNVSDDELVNNDSVKNLIDDEIENACSNMKKFEVPREWSFVAPFTAANNMLTPKMSIRRHVVIRTYVDVIAGMYPDPITSAGECKVDSVA